MKQIPKFSRSKVENLFKHRAGNYYAVAKVVGKVRRRSLETSDYNLAKERLPAALESLRGATEARSAGTVGAALLAEARREDPSIKASTKDYYLQVASSLIATSDAMESRPADKSLPRTTLSDLRGWMDKHAGTCSRTRYNGALALLRRVFERAIEAKQISRNLPEGLARLTPLVAQRAIPSVDEFMRVVSDIAGQKKRSSLATAAVVKLLAATGLRISEAQSLKWVDVGEASLVVRGAKNDELRRVPLTATAKLVLGELTEMYGVDPDSPVMPIKSPRIALENSCERLGLPHLRVHDLRHIFATRCIEAGVDLPTIASWLGHKDGGILAARIYGHVIASHSDTQINRVKI